MGQDKAMVRELIERIEGVTGTRFELEIKGASRKKTLVVEVDFDLDPNGGDFSRAKVDSIENTFATVIREENGDVVSKLKIVSQTRRATDKVANTATGQGATSKSAPANLHRAPN